MAREQTKRRAAPRSSIGDSDEPDVLLDVSVVKVDEIHFTLGEVELSIKGVEAQLLLRARVDDATGIVDRVLATLDRTDVQGGNGAGGGPEGGASAAGRLAREAAKVVARELGAAASGEARELGLAASHKAVELGERRRQRRVARRNATDAALREAETTGIDLEEIEGSGVDGRITLSDVREAVG